MQRERIAFVPDFEVALNLSSGFDIARSALECGREATALAFREAHAPQPCLLWSGNQQSMLIRRFAPNQGGSFATALHDPTSESGFIGTLILRNEEEFDH